MEFGLTRIKLKLLEISGTVGKLQLLPMEFGLMGSKIAKQSQLLLLEFGLLFLELVGTGGKLQLLNMELGIT